MQIMVRDAYAFGDDGGEDEDLGPSKSEVKRRMLALQALGKELTGLSEEVLGKLPLSEEVLEAVRNYQKIRTFKARQREVQHIGKLLRQADADAIRKAIADAEGTSSDMVAIQHQCERLRDELLASDAPLTDLMNRFPGIDLQKIRQSVRSARREAAKEDPAKRNPKFSREIYRMLHEALVEDYRSRQAAGKEMEEEE
ncbi:MAG: DUF615 domain-containing protein [Sutterellaceae bacterium]|nr:DUF615 domain-containing protein [Sutterellaceae bacterium]MDD7441873.1 ribosome biogenesis factor YjgA [Sutterellaceae bacterium]MDY2867723.1 ribosome biogenesis factor YjgA [Mesosutterella sp.]